MKYCSLIIAGTLLFSGNLNFENKNGPKRVYVGPPVGGGLTSVDIYSNTPTNYKRNFDNIFFNKYGLIRQEDNFLQYGEYVTYNSFWVPWEENQTTFLVDNEYTTYTFNNYIDIPIEIISVRKVLAGRTATFTLETQQSFTRSSEYVSTIGAELYSSFSNSLGLNVGVSIGLQNIGIGAKLNDTQTIVVGGSVSTIVQNTLLSSLTYSYIYRETFNFDNSNSDIDIYYQLNYRQKFKVYFTTNYLYNYTTTTWGSGLFNRDENFSYTFDSYNAVGTYSFLIPVEQPYFEVSEYIDGQNGLKEKIITTTNDSIVYF